MCQHSHQKYQQRQKHCLLVHLNNQCKKVKYSKQHESTCKRPSHITTYSTHSQYQQRTLAKTTRKKSQSLRWQRRCTGMNAREAKLSGVPFASIRIEDINNVRY
jgi:hypothetical protein